MSFPINSFEDILAAMEESPELATKLQTHVLTKALLKLPAVVGEPQDGDPPITDQLKRTDARISRVETVTGRVDGRTGDIEGRGYEARVARLLADRLYQELDMIHSTVVYRYDNEEDEKWFEPFNLKQPPERQLNKEQMRDLKDIDTVARGTRQNAAGLLQEFHVAVEASIIGEEHDVRRADRRSRLLANLTDGPCLPAIAAETLSERLKTLATMDSLGHTRISRDAFNSLELTGEALAQDVAVFFIERRR